MNLETHWITVQQSNRSNDFSGILFISKLGFQLILLISFLLMNYIFSSLRKKEIRWPNQYYFSN